MDTIFAQATALGRAGVSVIRISGPEAFTACSALAGDVPKARHAALRSIYDADGQVLDQGLVLTFPGPASFTGEDVVELHLHGSIAIVRAVLARLGVFERLRYADAGEFTRRAMDNGRLDLTQVEGLADLIDAETESQRKQAMRTLSGQLGEVVDAWRSRLIRAAALLEATIDFVDEDVPVDVSDEVKENLKAVEGDLMEQISGFSSAERIRHGFEVAIVGAPNVGKSTLLNRIAGRDAAITSEIAGTTRDVIEVKLDVNGLAVTLLDTAGLRESDDEVEKIGIAKARERAQHADLRVFLGDETDGLVEDGDIFLTGKGDLVGGSYPVVSGATGSGVKELLDDISEKLSVKIHGAGLATHRRHQEAMTRAAESIKMALSLLDQDVATYDIIAEEIRTALRAFEGLMGRIDVEDLLGEIFSSFCVGK